MRLPPIHCPEQRVPRDTHKSAAFVCVAAISHALQRHCARPFTQGDTDKIVSMGMVRANEQSSSVEIHVFRQNYECMGVVRAKLTVLFCEDTRIQTKV